MKTKPKIKYSKKTMITIILLGCAFLIYRIYIIRSRDNFNQEECTKITTTLRIRELLEEKNYTCLHNDNIVWKDIKSLILGPTKAYYERKHVSLGLEGKDIMFGGFAFAALATYNALKHSEHEFNDKVVVKWDVSGVIDMTSMLLGAYTFNQDISGWDVSSVINMGGMFQNAKAFNQDISGWVVGKVTKMKLMFALAEAFNQDISGWDVSNVENMSMMFNWAKAFNQDISNWDVSSVTDFTGMFLDSGLAKDPEKINLKKIYCSWKNKLEDKPGPFTDGPLGNLKKEMKRCGVNTEKVTLEQMNRLVTENNYKCLQNNNIDWDNVTSLESLFSGYIEVERDGKRWTEKRTFKTMADISDWEVGKVKNMRDLFLHNNTFNQDISDWDVSSVTSMFRMFGGTSFNKPLNWGGKVKNVSDMGLMFFEAKAFNQDISKWDVSGVTNFTGMFFNSGLSNNKPLLEKIYCSWKNILKGKKAPLTNLKNLKTEMKLHFTESLPKCDKTKPTYPPYTRDRGSKIIYRGYECLPNGDQDEVNLGWQRTPEDCEAECIKKAAVTGEECKWFIYGQKNGPKDGSCWWEKKCDKLEVDKYNVYEINNNNEQTRECPGEYPRLGWHEHGGRRYCYIDDPPRLNEKGLYACTHGDTFKDDGWGTFAEGGGADWVEKCVL